MPRTGLSLEAVVDEAGLMVDRDGWRELTMTALARRLGVQGPSLYHHVGGVEGVLAEVQVRACADMADRLQRAAMGRAGPGCFRALAQGMGAYAMEHPGLYELSLSEPIDAARVHAASEPSRAALTAVIRSFGIADPSLDLLLTCLAPLHGVLVLTRNGAIARPTQRDDIYRRATELVILMLESEGKD